jgi:hypothetical protein
MTPEPQLALGTDAERYAALFRISEALSACGEPEQLARILADQLRGLISFMTVDIGAAGTELPSSKHHLFEIVAMVPSSLVNLTVNFSL